MKHPIICKHLIVLAITLAGHFSIAQDLKVAIEKMREHYAEKSAMHIVMEIKAYHDQTEADAFFEEKADIKKRNQDYWYTFGTNEMYMNDKRMIIIDHGSKEMVHALRQPNSFQGLTDLFQVSMDSILGLYNTPAYLGVVKGAHQYSMVQKSGPVERVEVGIGVESGLLTLLTYTYRTGEKVRIVFVTFDTSPQFAAGTFDEKKFIQQGVNGLEPAGTYRNYYLFDQNNANSY